MKAGVARRAAALACAVAFALAVGLPVRAQQAAGAPAATASGPAHVVKKGETLYAIARKYRPAGATLNQMLVALFRANPQAFENEDANQLKSGSTLTIPGGDAVRAVDAAEAVRTVQSWQRKPAPPAPAAPPAVKETPAPLAPPKPAVKPVPGAKLNPAEAEARYKEGMALERAGNERAALQAFTDAGESGHGPAQKRLGEIYDKGNSVVTRDYGTALRWYQKAREQGIAIPKPFQFPAGH